jgi:predicted nucleotidyltransferase
MDTEMMNRIREILSPLRPAAVYLFGSAAADRLRAGSDIDLAILPTGFISEAMMLQTRLQLADALTRDVDLIDMERSSTVLRKEVLANGRLLYETDAARRNEFEMYALSDYARLNEERAPVLAALGQPLPRNA